MSFHLHLWPNDKITRVDEMTLDGYNACQACRLSPVEYAQSVESFKLGNHEWTSLYKFVAERISAINLGWMAKEIGWKPE